MRSSKRAGKTVPNVRIAEHERVPVILVGRQVPDWEGYCVCVDNFPAAYEATDFLIELGHRKIAHARGISDQDAEQQFESY